MCVNLGGANVQVVDCELASSVGSLWIHGEDFLVTGNRMHGGNAGYIGGRRFIFEDNTFDGDSLAGGGGVYCSELYYARNRMGMSPRHDGEIFTTDGGGPHTRVKIARLDGVQLDMDEAFAKAQPYWNFSTASSGARARAAASSTWSTANARAVPPHRLPRRAQVRPRPSLDGRSRRRFDHHLLRSQLRPEHPGGQLFPRRHHRPELRPGHRVVRGRQQVRRTGGLRAFTHGYNNISEPAWRLQFLANEILVGSSSRGPTSERSDDDAVLALHTGGALLRAPRQRLANNARIDANGLGNLIEGNTVRDAQCGIARKEARASCCAATTSSGWTSRCTDSS